MKRGLKIKLGLIGYPLSHSFSPRYFTEKFKALNIEDRWSYEAFPLRDFPDLAGWMKEKELRGLNITLPHKTRAAAAVDDRDDWAHKSGSVNTILLRPEGSLSGFNTDAPGFLKSLKRVTSPVKTALILGTGGASRGVVAALHSLGSEVVRVSRASGRGDCTYDELRDLRIERFDLIVNTTPLGMYPKSKEAPEIPYSRLKSHQILYDLVYNPAETVFLTRGKSSGCSIINGLEMLKAQAELSWEIWRAGLSPTTND